MKPKLFKECCVCLQNRLIVTKCKKCKKVAVCNDCILSMCEQGICDKCPVCRQKDWKKSKKKLKRSKIVPSRNLNEIINQDESNILCSVDLCCITTRDGYILCLFNRFTCIAIVKFLQMITIIFGAGVLTLLLFTGPDLDFSIYWWAPIVIGLFEFLLGISCCYGCCGIKVGIKEVCFFSLEKI